MSISQTIMNQMGGRAKLTAMVGATRLASTGGDENVLGGLSFKFKGSSKANICGVYLNNDDTYTVKFWKMGRGAGSFKQVEEFSGVYCDQLVEMFESVTGLYLSL